MPTHAEAIRLQLSSGPRTARQLAGTMHVSQPTVSRALSNLSLDIVTIGAARSIQYALRDTSRGLPDIPVYRVDTTGQIHKLGTLIPVRQDGFVMHQEDQKTLHSDGLPWWLYDMRPQGFLGRAYATRHGANIGLPDSISDWNDTHILRALLTHGHDMTGNLLLGDLAREHFLTASVAVPITEHRKPEDYARLAREAADGEIPGSSAGGEQPKFAAYAVTSDGPSHVIVKFSEPEENSVSERWRDLLLAEHLALETLTTAGIEAAKTSVIDHNGQRFLEVRRFDRIEPLGRRALHSLAALDAEFVGAGRAPWPTITRRLRDSGVITPAAADGAALLWAFGTLIGNTDMHNGNLSFLGEHGRPYHLAPAYDMTPMAFSPRSSGSIPDSLGTANISAEVANPVWRHAEELAQTFLARLTVSTAFSRRFSPCIAALTQHIQVATATIARLG